MHDLDIINLWKKGTPKNLIVNAEADDLRRFSNFTNKKMAREVAYNRVEQVLLKEYRRFR